MDVEPSEPKGSGRHDSPPTSKEPGGNELEQDSALLGRQPGTRDGVGRNTVVPTNGKPPHAEWRTTEQVQSR